MKYTISGFSQLAAVNFNLDSVDLHMLRWIVDFYRFKSNAFYDAWWWEVLLGFLPRVNRWFADFIFEKGADL